MAEERLKRDGGERSADEESPTKKSRVASVLGPNSKVDDAAADKRHAGGETTVGDAEIGAEGDGAGVQDRATNKDTAATGTHTTSEVGSSKWTESRTDSHIDCAQDLHPRRDVALASEAR